MKETREGEKNLNHGNYTAGMGMCKVACSRETGIAALLFVFFENKNK